MKEVLTKWYRRYLSEEEAVVLLVLLISAFGVTLAFGDILAPVFVAVILAYLCLLYTSPSPRDATLSRMPSSA